MKKSNNNNITLSQLRTLVAICDNNLSVTAAANQLNVTQPSISKKLSALEQCIGKTLFYRNGKRFQYETHLCRQVTELAREILLKCDNLAMLSSVDEDTNAAGQLMIGTTHTQARYVLPQVITRFRNEYPNVTINIRQGSPAELVQLLNSNQLDFVICTEALEKNNNFRTMVSFSWNRCLLVPPEHPLAKARNITLQQLAKHPIVTYTTGFTGRNAFDTAFSEIGLIPRIMVSATDADVIKKYVKLGFGVGVVAEMACSDSKNRGLVVRPLKHLFPDMYVRLAYQREKFVPGNMQRFIELFRQLAGQYNK